MDQAGSFSRVYMTVDLPREVEANPDNRASLAFLEARERMRTYVMPARWHVVWDDGERVRVCRTSHRHPRKG